MIFKSAEFKSSFSFFTSAKTSASFFLLPSSFFLAPSSFFWLLTFGLENLLENLSRFVSLLSFLALSLALCFPSFPLFSDFQIKKFNEKNEFWKALSRLRGRIKPWLETLDESYNQTLGWEDSFLHSLSLKVFPLPWSSPLLIDYFTWGEKSGDRTCSNMWRKIAHQLLTMGSNFKRSLSSFCFCFSFYVCFCFSFCFSFSLLLLDFIKNLSDYNSFE